MFFCKIHVKHEFAPFLPFTSVRYSLLDKSDQWTCRPWQRLLHQTSGRRYGTHLLTSLTSVGFHNINCVNGKEAHNIMEWHIEKTTACTAEEYNSLNGDDTGLQADMRRPFCEYIIYNTSPFDALTTLTYLFRAQDLPIQCP